MSHEVLIFCRARAIGPVNLGVSQGINYLFHFPAIVDGRKAFDVLKDEHLWPFECKVIDNVMDNITSSFCVFETLPLSCHREGLTGEAGDVKVHGGYLFNITLGQVSKELIGFEVSLYHSFDMFISIRTELMFERNFKVPQSLDRSFNA